MKQPLYHFLSLSLPATTLPPSLPSLSPLSRSQAGTRTPTCSTLTSQLAPDSPTSPILVAMSPMSGRWPQSSGTSFRVSTVSIPSTQSWTSTSWGVAMVSRGKMIYTVGSLLYVLLANSCTEHKLKLATVIHTNWQCLLTYIYS